MNRYHRQAAGILCWVFFFVASLVAQDVDQYVKQVKRGNYDQARAALPQLKQEHPNAPGVLYLQGLLATDGERAHRYFKEVADSPGWNSYKDDAIIKVAEYLYARGLYNGAGTYLRKIPVHHPGSPHLHRALTLLLNSFIEAGKIDSARVWQDIIAREFPHLKVEDRLASADEPKRMVTVSDTASAPKPVDLSRENPYVDTKAGTSGAGESVRELEEGAQERSRPYSIQVGAFSTLDNAMQQKKRFESLGYSLQIRQRKRGDVELYLVWLGKYATREQAAKIGREIESRLDTPYFIVKSD